MSKHSGRSLTLLNASMLAALLLFGAHACGGDNGDGTKPQGDDNNTTNPNNDDGPDAGDGDDLDADDNTDPNNDDGPDADVEDEDEEEPIDQVGFGEPCRSNLDCESGYCSTSPQGFVCTQSCIEDEDCPALGDTPMRCRLTENFGPDGVRICTPAVGSLCQPCFRDDQCFGGACVELEGGSVCGLDCEEDNDCPENSACQRFSPDGETLATPQCLPRTLACDCNEETAGDTRPCVRVEEGIGTCFGVETCEPARGWVGCDATIPADERCDGLDNNCNGAIDDGLGTPEACENANDFGTCTGFSLCEGEAGFVCQAPEPDAESCDLVDNDCDGDVDEDFRDDDGVYNSSEHCGVCNNNCDGRFDLAAATACEVIDGVAQCIITECRRGFTLAGPTTCLPLASELCAPCTTDDECNADVGDRCISYGEQSFCGRDCSDDSPFGAECPSGYTCDGESNQCRLESGSCLCGPNDNFIRPCSIPDPNDDDNNCIGTLSCVQGELSACEPPADSCNGIDDDCDGVIDNDLRDPDSGQYFTDEHCGRCFNNCPLTFNDPSLNGVGACNGFDAINRGQRPECILNCNPGFANVNGVIADGCECQIETPNEDDPDPQGRDSDCDGIDGQISRGIFVSRSGSDNNPGTRVLPVRNIQTAINRAGGLFDHVYVSAGVYEESITLRTGISVFGGYNSDYSQRDLAGNETAIFGEPPEPGELGAVNAFNVNGETTVIAGFTVVGFDNNAPGSSSYAFHITNSGSDLVIRNNVIRGGNAGNGVPGGTGNVGQDAPDNATLGQPQRSAGDTICSNNRLNQSQGGNGGVFSCTDQNNNNISTNGGDGGAANCPTYNEPEGSGTAGQAPGFGGLGGPGGYNQLLIENESGFCSRCLIPTESGSTEVGVPGDDGANGDPGVPGRGCSSGIGRVNPDGEWVAGPLNSTPNDPSQPNNGIGGTGLKGIPGGGGGGGGAGSGVQRQPIYFFNCAFREVIGGGGGGGGAGGCGGTGGTGGTPGGASFGVFIRFITPPATVPVVINNTIERGFGGIGGDGGAGAEGGSGALGKDAQALSEAEQVGLLVCSDPGGRGGDGGDGGAGGGGGGGCGGLSTGIFIFNHGNLDTNAYGNLNAFPDTGAGGTGGRGGVSIGNLGLDGADGLYLEVAR